VKNSPTTPGLSTASHARVVELAYQLILAERYGGSRKEGND